MSRHGVGSGSSMRWRELQSELHAVAGSAARERTLVDLEDELRVGRGQIASDLDRLGLRPSSVERGLLVQVLRDGSGHVHRRYYDLVQAAELVRSHGPAA